MKRLFLASLLVILPLGSQAQAATFNITTTSGGGGVLNCASDPANPKVNCNLQEALTVAETNGSDDTLNLAAGSGGNYNNSNNGNAPFAYAGTDGTSLTVIGAGMGVTILDATGSSGSQVMNLDTSGPLSNISVSQITFQNSNAPGFFAGGLEIGTDDGDIQLEGCEFTNNVGKFFGGVIANSTTGQVTLDGNVFTGNTGGNAGGATLNSVSGALTLANNTFLGNTGNFAEGATNITSNSGPVLLVNNIFSENKVNSTGGGGDGGGVRVVVTTSSIDLINNTIVNNQVSDTIGAAQGGGIYASLGTNTASLNLFNNIVFGNSADTGEGQDIFVDLTGAPTALVNLFNNDFTEACFDTGAGANCNFAGFLGGNQADNVIAQDPLFVDAEAGNFQLGLGSPALATGDIGAPNLPATDHDGNPRTIGGTVDIGALEAQPAISVNPNPFNFGQQFVSQGTQQIFTISNAGPQALQVSDVTLSDTVNFKLILNGGPNPCGPVPFSVEGGGDCTALLSFRPQSTGSFSATVDIASDDPDDPILSILLSGTGSTAIINGGSCSLSGPTSPSAYLCLGMFLVMLGVWSWGSRVASAHPAEQPRNPAKGSGAQ